MPLSIRVSAIAALALILASGCSCTQQSKSSRHFQSGESVVLIGETPANLLYPPSTSFKLVARSTYPTNSTGTVRYEEGKDYILDSTAGTIRRTANSRIPDFSTNILYGKEEFDHSKFPGFSNLPFFLYVDYGHDQAIDWPVQSAQKNLLPLTVKKLQTGGPLKIIAYGDSITAGGEATQPSLIYWQRWADALQAKYPKAYVEAVNGATGGDTTRNGLDRLTNKVLTQKPDLVIVAFGMNDHNVPQFGVPLDEFKRNLGTIIDRIRSETGAEIILLSTFPPNPKWRFGSHQMEKYAHATEQVAQEKQCAFADIYHNWNAIAARKKPEDLLGNNINHPNDFGHWMYFQVLNQIGL